jgi:hypothetical protein
LSAHFVSIAYAVERRIRLKMEKTLMRVLFDNPAARDGRLDSRTFLSTDMIGVKLIRPPRRKCSHTSGAFW